MVVGLGGEWGLLGGAIVVVDGCGHWRGLIADALGEIRQANQEHLEVVVVLAGFAEDPEGGTMVGRGFCGLRQGGRAGGRDGDQVAGVSGRLVVEPGDDESPGPIFVEVPGDAVDHVERHLAVARADSG